MIEIKNIIFTSSKMHFIKCIICFINCLLPLKFKFANESFVALIDGKQQGIITLDKDSKSTTRFKITKLILEENSYSIAKELTNYALTKYKASGASSFYVVVDETKTDLLNIFQNELNFRMCAKEYLYKIESYNPNFPLFLKPFKKQMVKKICNFYNENINSFNRFLFSRNEYQFFNNCKKYIFYDNEKDNILGYFEVATKNNLDYYINFAIDFAYNSYLLDAVNYIYSKLLSKNKNFNLYIKIKDYFLNSKELINILNENNAHLISKSRILARDYYKEIKNRNILKNAKIIFNDPTIA